MAYTEISTSLITSGKALLYTLFQLIKDNFDNHDSRVSAMESGVVVVPSGAVIKRGTDVVPSGFLLCDGTAVSRTTYADLFTALGINYGSGDGLSTFNVPDLRGRSSYGTTLPSGVAVSSGEEDHVLTEAEMPVHTHTTTDPGHGHSYPTAQNGNRTVPIGGDVNDFQNFANTLPPLSFGDTADVNPATTGLTIADFGGDVEHNNMHPVFVCAYMVKT